MTEFLGEEHSFLEYEKLVLKYKTLISELQFEVQKVLYLTFAVVCVYSNTA